MALQVNPDLLAEPRSFLGLEVSPPDGWTPLPADQLAALAAASAGQESKFATRPLGVFGDPSTGLLIASEVAGPGVEAYEALLQERPQEVRTDRFEVNGVRVHQYVIQLEGQVNYKLLLWPPAALQHDPAREGHRRWLQLDYIVPRDQWEAQRRSVESSIGSVRPLRGRPQDRGPGPDQEAQRPPGA